MDANGRFTDPYCSRDFWRERLQARSRFELEAYLNDFDRLLQEVEQEYRIVMTANRAEVLREALLDLARVAARQAHNTRQGDLFE